MTNVTIPNPSKKGYELPGNVEPVFDPITGDFVTYAEKAEGPTEDVLADILVQSDEDVNGTPEVTVH